MPSSNPHPVRQGRRCRITLLAAALAAATAHSAGPVPRHADACTTCHGSALRGASPDVPHLAGQPAPYLLRQLLAFQSGGRRNPVMRAIAAQLDAQDLRDLATYWSRQPWASPSDEPTPSALHSEMQLPSGFPAGFSVYDRAQDEASRTVTLRYANAAALDAARAGRSLPPGAIVMSAEHRAVLGPDRLPMKDGQGRWLTGEMKSLAGMETRPGWGDRMPALLRNGDWNYGLWGPSGESWLRGSQGQCLACHKPQAATQHVFTWASLARPAGP